MEARGGGASGSGSTTGSGSGSSGVVALFCVHQIAGAQAITLHDLLDLIRQRGRAGLGLGLRRPGGSSAGGGGGASSASSITGICTMRSSLAFASLLYANATACTPIDPMSVALKRVFALARRRPNRLKRFHKVSGSFFDAMVIAVGRKLG